MIVVFGSLNIDLVANVERFPLSGETVPGISFAIHPGGKGANQALAARRAGARVAMAGAIGDDAFAAPATANLVEAGIDVASVRRVGGSTGIASILVDASGRNQIAVIAGANGRVDGEYVPAAMLGPANTLVLQLEIPLEAVEAVAARARGLGARVVLNAAPARRLPHTLLSALDVLIVNEHEAAYFARCFDLPEAPQSFAESIHRQRGCATVVTLGERGALAAVQQAMLEVRAPTVDVVDSTGAGDAFAGALAAALDRGEAWPRALAEGVAAGSLACTAPGAQAALPAFADIARLASEVQSTLVLRPLE